MNTSDTQNSGWAIVIVVLAIAAGLIVRLLGLGDPSVSHTEVYVPGLALVAGISEPPPRLNFMDALWWHYHDEPHPMGWYLAMFGWTSFAGTSEFAIRLPAVLAGIVAIPFLYLVGRRTFGPEVAAVAVVLLALHGFHVFWSQNARMYTAGACLGLIATWFLIKLAADPRARPSLALGYVLTCVAGVQTVEFFWPFLFLHIGWVMVTMPAPSSISGAALRHALASGPRLLQIQSIALILSAPGLLHSAYRARQGAGGVPDVNFLVEYFSFGFLFARDPFRYPTLELPTALIWALLALAVILFVTSLRAPSFPKLTENAPSLPGWVAPVLAVIMAGVMVWLALIAHRRNEVLMALAVLPLLALLLPAFGLLVRGILSAIPFVNRLLAAGSPVTFLLWLLGVVGPLILMAASFVVDVAAPRAFLIFVPYLILLGAAGCFGIVRAGPLRLAPAIVLTVVFALSVPYAANKPVSPNDYKGLAQGMRVAMEPGDLIFLRHRQWADTPFLYYMGDGDFVTENHGSALSEHPDARIWLVTWPNEDQPVITDARRSALADYTRIEVVEAFRASAELFVRETSQ